MLIRGATLVTLDPPRVEEGDLRLEGERIVERAVSLAPRPGEQVVDAEGGLILPGLVNAHTHLYSALARGMPGPAVAPRSFVQILERVWWRLDRALDEEAVRLSGLVGGVEAALAGTTLLVDHHSSPSFIDGSLDTLKQALEAVGLRSVLCYEVTDRNGPEGRDRGLAENARFLAEAPGPLTRGMVGAHASFTLSDDSLGRIGRAASETDSGVHIHVAEDVADVEDCRRRHRQSLTERLAGHGVLTARALLAHCVHLSPAELDAVHVRGAWTAHNPRSNMNNHVGYAPAEAMRRSALGTDGMDQDMLAEARAAYLKMRDSGRDDAMPATLEMLSGGHRLASALFGLPFGTLDAGGPADLVLFDYRPPTPLHAGNLGGHLLFGMDRSHVRSAMVAGRWIVRDRVVTGVDVALTFARAAEAAARLWPRMAAL